MRLLKKSSRPSQHVQKPSAPAKPRPKLTHSDSYYKPKIIQENPGSAATYVSQTPMQSPPASKPSPPTLSPPKTPLHKARSSPSQSTSESSPTIPTLASTTAKRPVVPIYSPDYAFNPAKLHRQRTQLESSSGSGSPSRDSSRTRQNVQASHSPAVMTRSRFRPDTPPEAEPRTPYESADTHGSHYFRTFGTDTMYQKTETRETPSTTSKHGEHDDVPSALPTSPISPLPSSMQSIESSPGQTKPRRGSSIFGKLRNPGETLHIFHGHKAESGMPTSPTPDITVSLPQLARSRRRSTLTGYFIRSRRAPPSSDATPSPSPSVLSTN